MLAGSLNPDVEPNCKMYCGGEGKSRTHEHLFHPFPLCEMKISLFLELPALVPLHLLCEGSGLTQAHAAGDEPHHPFEQAMLDPPSEECGRCWGEQVFGGAGDSSSHHPLDHPPPWSIVMLFLCHLKRVIIQVKRLERR